MEEENVSLYQTDPKMFRKIINILSKWKYQVKINFPALLLLIYYNSKADR